MRSRRHVLRFAMVVDDGALVSTVRWRCVCARALGPVACLCITDGASECQGQAVHFFACLRERVCASPAGASTYNVRGGPVLWVIPDRAPSCICLLSIIGYIGTRISAHSFLFSSLPRSSFSFVFFSVLIRSFVRA